MLRQIASHFGMGLVAVLPFVLVIWVLVGIFQFVDGILGPYVDNIRGVHLPGLGFALVLVITTFLGALTRLYISHRILSAMDRLFTRIPFVKSLYSMFKELIQSLIGKQRGFQEAVLVPWPDDRALVLGLVTSSKLPREVDPEGKKIAVYLPNAFQFAGLTVIVNRDLVRPCDWSAEDAFKFAISAGLGRAADPIISAAPFSGDASGGTKSL